MFAKKPLLSVIVFLLLPMLTVAVPSPPLRPGEVEIPLESVVEE